MEIGNLRNYIIEEDKIPTILENLGCHHIKDKGKFYNCGNPDGDNVKAIVVYKETLITEDYTRSISKREHSDIFDLVMYIEDISFFYAIKKICNWIDLDYYHDFNEDLPESLKITKMIMQLENDDIDENETKPIKPISEKILTYYKNYQNNMFKEDGISYSTQKEFEVGYDPERNCITIPIRDEIGTLVGIKGRFFQDTFNENESKYTYLEPCARGRVLYGLHKTLPYIKEEKFCFVGESEKSVMQLWDMGYCNCCATSGKKLSHQQIEKLTRICDKLIFLFDKDVDIDEIKEIASNFIDSVQIYSVIDSIGILNDKESPTDNSEKFHELINKCIVQIN